MLKTQFFKHRYIPARKPGLEEKLLVVFHGLGDSLSGFLWMPSALNVDALSFLLVNAPDDYFGGFSWFDFQGDIAPGIVRSRQLILNMLDELYLQGVKPENVILFGFSQGCLMALDIGLRSPKIFAGVCGVSGWLAFEEEYPAAFSPAAKKQNFLVTHGLQDPLLPFEESKRQSEFLQSLDVNLRFLTYDKEHTILPEELEEIRKWLVERMDATRIGR
jgi:phospholipase/carboxylesterase